MATKSGFEEIYKGYYVYKYSDQSGNTYYMAKALDEKSEAKSYKKEVFITSERTITEVKNYIDTQIIPKQGVKTR